MRIISATTAIGDEVVNPAGEDLGEVEEIMFDVNTGRITYAVLSFGGILGLGEKYFAIPWEALTLHEEHKHFVLNVPKEVLKNAEGFDKDNWPDFANPDWNIRTYEYYGYKPFWEMS